MRALTQVPPAARGDHHQSGRRGNARGGAGRRRLVQDPRERPQLPLQRDGIFGAARCRRAVRARNTAHDRREEDRRRVSARISLRRRRRSVAQHVLPAARARRSPCTAMRASTTGRISTSSSRSSGNTAAGRTGAKCIRCSTTNSPSCIRSSRIILEIREALDPTGRLLNAHLRGLFGIAV